MDKNMILPKDSGFTREFATGAHRDDATGKGRCDLLPLREVAMVFHKANEVNINEKDAPSVFLENIALFMEKHNVEYLANAILAVHASLDEYKDKPLEYMMLDVSHLYEAGALKYGENNWQNGMPLNCYIDSAIRHYFKARSHITDEPHYRGPVWNLLCAMWTANNIPNAFENLRKIE